MEEHEKTEYINKYLFDILTAINEIESFIAGKPRLFKDFCEDLMLHRAIERNIEIIGEASNRILKLDASIPIANARQAVDTRNFVVHGYDKIDDSILWNIVINDLPILKAEVLSILPKEDLELFGL